MEDRDTPGTGGPNRKASDPMGRNTMNQSGMGQSNNANPGNMNAGNRGSDIGRMTEEAGEAGRQSLGSAQTRIRSMLEQQTHRAADQLGGVAHALHKAAEQLSHENNGVAARYADQAAERVGQVADMLRNSTMDDMVGQVERFARRQPEVFIGAAFAVGFMVARFVKSSGERRFQGQARTMSAGTGTGYGRDDRGYGENFGTRSYGAEYGAGVSTRGMAGGIAGSAGSTGFGETSRTLRDNSATAATGTARTRDAAELMAGGSPEPIGGAAATATGTGATAAAASAAGSSLSGTTGAGTKGAGTAGADKTAAVPDTTLGATPAADAKPQGTIP